MGDKGLGARHAAAVYWRSVTANYRSIVEYPADFWVMLFAGSVWQVIGFAFIAVLFSAVDAVGGWTYHEMLLLTGFFTVCRSVTALFWQGIWNLGGLIVKGGIDYLIIRPAPVALQVASNRIGLEGFGSVTVGIAMTATGWTGAGLGFGAVPLALFLLLWASAVQLAILTAACSVNFWLKGGMPVVGFAIQDLEDEGLRYPLSVFPAAVRLSFTFVLPIAFTSFIPVQILTGELSRAWLIAPPLAAAVTVALAAWLFRTGLRVYDSAGH